MALLLFPYKTKETFRTTQYVGRKRVIRTNVRKFVIKQDQFMKIVRY